MAYSPALSRWMTQIDKVLDRHRCTKLQLHCQLVGAVDRSLPVHHSLAHPLQQPDGALQREECAELPGRLRPKETDVADVHAPGTVLPQ